MLATYRPVNKTVILFMSHSHLIVTPFCLFFVFVFYIQHKDWLICFCFVLLNQGLHLIFFVKKKTFPSLPWCYLLFYSGSFIALASVL